MKHISICCLVLFSFSFAGCGEFVSLSQKSDVEVFSKSNLEPFVGVRFKSGQHASTYLEYSFLNKYSSYAFPIDKRIEEASKKFLSSPAYSLEGHLANKKHGKQMQEIFELKKKIRDYNLNYDGSVLEKLQKNRLRFYKKSRSTDDSKQLQIFAQRLNDIDRSILVEKGKQKPLENLKNKKIELENKLKIDMKVFKENYQVTHSAKKKVNLGELLEKTNKGEMLTLDFRESQSQILLWPIRYKAIKQLWEEPVNLTEKALKKTTSMFMLVSTYNSVTRGKCKPVITPKYQLPPNIFLIETKNTQNRGKLVGTTVDHSFSHYKISTIWLADGEIKVNQLIQNAEELKSHGCDDTFLRATKYLYPENGFKAEN